MKTVRHLATARDKLLHIETEGAVVNIRVGLTDSGGRKVTSVEILPDRYSGEEWHLDGYTNTRVIEGKEPEAPPEPEDDETLRPTTLCGCGHELIWVGGHWEHNIAPYIWGDDHDPDEPEPTGPAREYWDQEDCVS